jgi:hypothetical protein
MRVPTDSARAVGATVGARNGAWIFSTATVVARSGSIKGLTSTQLARAAGVKFGCGENSRRTGALADGITRVGSDALITRDGERHAGAATCGIVRLRRGSGGCVFGTLASVQAAQSPMVRSFAFFPHADQPFGRSA